MKENEPDFAVVIPVFNGSAHIGKAIESCLQQSVLPKEVIVVDDASTDNTPTLVQAFEAKQVRYFRNDHNSGPSASRNRGMDNVSAKWILFLDADDVFHPQKIEIIKHCIQNNHLVKAIGHSFAVGENVSNRNIHEVPALRSVKEEEVLLKNPVVTPALCIEAKNIIRFNEKMSYAEDHDFILRTVEQYNLYFLDLPLCSLQRRPLTAGGLSSNKWKMRKGEMNMYIDYCKRHHQYLRIPFLLLFSMLKHARKLLFATKPEPQ